VAWFGSLTPSNWACDFLPTALSDVTLQKNLLNQRLAEHTNKGQGEKEDKDEEPLPIETKGSSKDVEDRTDLPYLSKFLK
jgi:hypothetical protein